MDTHWLATPPLSNSLDFVFGRLALDVRELSERCHDRLYRVDHAEVLDVDSAGFFFCTSSFSRVLLFRRALRSVHHVLLFVSAQGLTEEMPWAAMVRLRPSLRFGSLLTFTVWNRKKESCLLSWLRWIREDQHPKKWLQDDFVPPPLPLSSTRF